jgi:hypothetical protein
MEITYPVLGVIVSFLVFIFGIIKIIFPGKNWEGPLREHQEKTEEMFKGSVRENAIRFQEIEKSISSMREEIRKIDGEQRLTSLMIAERTKRQEEMLNEIRIAQKDFQRSIEKRFDAIQEQIKNKA